MIDSAEKADICAQLDRLLAAGDLSSVHQKTGTRLRARLTSQVSVVLAGPEIAAKEYLYDILSEAALPQTGLTVLPWGDPLDHVRTDVCIWCTASFDVKEAAQWDTAPDRLKDHSFLAMFAGTSPAATELHAAFVARLQDIAAEEFYHLIEIAFGNRASSKPPKAVSELVSELSQMVHMGLAADMDNAHLFLKTHKMKPLGNPAVISAVTTSAPEPTAPAVMPRSSNPPEQSEVEVYEKALQTMQDHLVSLKPLMRARQDPEFNQILELCKTTSEAVADVMHETNLQVPRFAALRDETMSAADTILLMSLEGGIAPAVSAVTTVLQLRREMEGALAC